MPSSRISIGMPHTDASIFAEKSVSLLNNSVIAKPHFTFFCCAVQLRIAFCLHRIRIFHYITALPLRSDVYSIILTGFSSIHAVTFSKAMTALLSMDSFVSKPT